MLCDAEGIDYDDATLLGKCPYCGFTAIYIDYERVRTQAYQVIKSRAGSSKEEYLKALEEADVLAKAGDYGRAVAKYSIANAIYVEDPISYAGALNCMMMVNPSRTIYQMQYVHGVRVFFRCIESMATEDDYNEMERRYGRDFRRNSFEYWYNGVKPDIDAYRTAIEPNLRKYRGEQIRKRAVGMCAGLRMAQEYAKTPKQIEMLKNLIGDSSLIIVDKIVYGYFGNITGHDSVVIPLGVQYIYKDAFMRCKLKSIRIPKSMLGIDTNSFFRAEIDTMVIDEESVADDGLEIGKDAFIYASIGQLEANARMIKKGAFMYTNIGEMSFGKVSIIGSDAFNGANIGRATFWMIEDLHDRAFENLKCGVMDIDTLKKFGDTPFNNSTGSLRVRLLVKRNQAMTMDILTAGSHMVVFEGKLSDSVRDGVNEVKQEAKKKHSFLGGLFNRH
jgi:hypothetical protein